MAQIRVALRGNVAMLIWLGKQLLGQADKTETEVTGKIRLAFDPATQGPALEDPGIRAEILALDEKIERLRLTHESDASLHPGADGD